MYLLNILVAGWCFVLAFTTGSEGGYIATSCMILIGVLNLLAAIL
jgi:hypothetical protein